MTNDEATQIRENLREYDALSLELMTIDDFLITADNKTTSLIISTNRSVSHQIIATEATKAKIIQAIKQQKDDIKISLEKL